MNSNAHPFNFDVNFGMGNESVFTDIDLQYSAVIPPPPGPPCAGGAGTPWPNARRWRPPAPVRR